MDSVAGMLRRGDDVPASYQYGAPLMRLTVLGFRLMSQSAGTHKNDLTAIDLGTTLYLLARVTTALISSSGIVAMYLAARCALPFDRRSVYVGLTAALLYSVASELVLHSRYGVTDACLVGLTAWTIACTARYVATRELRWGVMSQVAAGLTFAFKVPGVVTSLMPIFAALFLSFEGFRAGTRRNRHMVLVITTIPMIIAIYVVLNPHVVDRYAHAMGDLIGRYKQTRDGGFSSVYLREPGLPHLSAALWAMASKFPSRSMLVSLVVSAITIAGFVECVRMRNVPILISACYAVCLTLSVALPNRTFLFRNYLVVVPSMCLGFGVGLVTWAEMTHRRLSRYGSLGDMVTAALAAVATAALIGEPLYEAVMAQRFREDPRVRALQWLSRQVDGDTAVAVTPSVFGAMAMGGDPSIAAIVQPPGMRFVSPELTSCPSPALTVGPEFLIDASYRNTQTAPPQDPWEEQWLFSRCPGYEQVASFGPNGYEVNLQAHPTWYGRVSVIVLRRGSGS